MRILHVCNTSYTNCGIGNFALNFHKRLDSITNSKVLFCSDLNSLGKYRNIDAIIFHHEFSFESTGLLKAIKDVNAKKTIAFIHSDCRGKDAHVNRIADGFICMSNAMVRTSKPLLVCKCPGFYLPLMQREDALQSFGYDRDTYLVGTFSMVSHNRQANKICLRLLDLISGRPELNSVKILIASASHEAELSYLVSVRAKSKLNDIQGYEKALFRFDNEFKSNTERNALMQACSLMWCYSSVTGRRYASASCSDMYASGTKLIVSDGFQHSAVLGLENVSTVKGLNGVISMLITNIKSKIQTRAEPIDDMKFDKSFNGLNEFIRKIAE